MRRACTIAARTILTLVALVLAMLAAYAGLLGYTWYSENRTALPEPLPGRSDFSRLSRAQNVTVIAAEGEPARGVEQLRHLVADATARGKKVTIVGAKHSMGGHTLLDGSLCIDMRTEPFQQIAPVVTRDGIPVVRVGAGATWHELLARLDAQGWSVAVMQSNDDFTIGGSLSVNCHGWRPNSPPLASTIESFRVLLADGTIRDCHRDRADDRELFRAVCGGYGLLGVVLEVDLRVVPNALYRAQEFSATAETYARRLSELTSRSDGRIGLAYGRISVAPGPWFLRDARVIRFLDTSDRSANPPRDTVAANGGQFMPAPWEIDLARVAFRASALFDFAKLGRWSIERLHGQTHRLVSRNGILQTPSDWFANRDPAFTEILHEYFVPPERLADFLDDIRPILRQEREINLLNVTVRHVQPDHDSLLTYAPHEVLGLVMLFRYRADADDKMHKTTERLIDAALSCGGSYYLPYRPHARRDQFQRAYPKADEFYAVKRKYDPHETFENSFYVTFIKPPQ